MSFFDPRMRSEILPDAWFDYDAHVEVDSRNRYLIDHLTRTGWICFRIVISL